MAEIAYVNGTFCELKDAKVSIEDRGFQFADGVYEVVVAPRRRPFLLEEHLARLVRSGEGIGLSIGVDRMGLHEVIAEGIRRCELDDVLVYVQITRGAAPRAHAFPEGLQQTVVLTFKAKPVIDPTLRRRGISVQTVQDIRWAKPFIKSIALLPNVVLRAAALREGFHDAVLLGPGGEVRETTCANVFMVFGGKLCTPPATEHILRGVSRDFLLHSAAEAGIEVCERQFGANELLAADEVFITSTTQDVMPVTSIDGTAVGDAAAGPITRQLLSRLQEAMTAG